MLADISTLLVAGIDPGQVSMKMSEAALATLSGRAELDRILAAHPAARARLTLEIAEDVFIARASGMIRSGIAHFRSGGLRMSLDDFGTGFASFRHLRQLEFDELKIDQSLVADLGRNRAADVLVEGVITIARGLRLPVIAEGIETQTQRQILLRMGCTLGQGFLFGPALPFAAVRDLLAADRDHPR